jgi:hypothetical protein
MGMTGIGGVAPFFDKSADIEKLARNGSKRGRSVYTFGAGRPK